MEELCPEAATESETVTSHTPIALTRHAIESWNAPRSVVFTLTEPSQVAFARKWD